MEDKPATADAVANVGSAPTLRHSPAATVENALLAALLGMMMVLPVAEIVLRFLIRTGVPGSVVIVQHLVMAVGMVGGAVAARENRLLSFSAASHRLKGAGETAAHIVAHGFATAVSAYLCGASWLFVGSQRSLGKILIAGVPVWAVQSLLIVGFGLIAIRLVLRSGNAWPARLATAVLAGTLIAAALLLPIEPEHLRWPAMLLLLISVILGAPIFTALGGAAMILLWTGSEPITPVPLKFYQLTVNPTLPSIPLFTLAGFFLAESKAARRLVALFHSLFGGHRGGAAIVATLACAFFTSFTGASGATILALGGVLMPVLIADGYSQRSSLGLLTGAGSLGMLFPPCLPPILYSVIASSGGEVSVTIEQVFKGGFLPGMLLVILTAWWGRHIAPRPTTSAARTATDWEAVGRAAWEAKWELMVPVVAIGTLFSGFATPVESAAFTALYTFVVTVAVHRDLGLRRDVPRVMAECGLLMGGVLLILGVALGFTHYLVDAQIPDLAVEWVTGTIHSKWLFLAALNLVLLVIGGLVEIYAAIVVVVPLLVPLGTAFGIDPVHLGIIFLANMELGFLAPPVGLNLLLASYRFNRPVGEVIWSSLPMLGVMLLGVLLITYVPWLTTWLPSVWQ
ncbi:C4-dicarboxylate ABC transporter permease [Opitutaceae bacterium EW11]|nr:C4-dicarboxylate ABC transporter permease [Opitutaceae bacterium EW11]